MLTNCVCHAISNKLHFVRFERTFCTSSFSANLKNNCNNYFPANYADLFWNHSIQRDFKIPNETGISIFILCTTKASMTSELPWPTQLLWYLYSIMKWKIPWCSGLAFYNAKNNRYCKWIVPNFSSRILKYIFSHETTFQKSWLDGHKWFYPWEFSNLMSWVEPHPALNCEGSVLSITNHITFIQFAASSFLSYHWSKSRHTQFHWRSMNICCRRRREENIHFVKRFLIVILLQNSYVDI